MGIKAKFIASPLLLLLITFTSCPQGADQAGSKGITVATLRGPAGISMVHMMDSLEELGGQQLDYQLKNEPMQVRPLLFQEKAEFAVVPTNMASILYNKGVNYQLAAVPVWGTLYLFGDDEAIHAWKDLEGKKIYLMAKGMTPDVMFRYLLQKNGIDPGEDVQLDYSFPTHIELANAVASGKARLAVISEPLVSMVINKNQRVKPLISLNDAWKKQTDSEIPQTALLVHRDFAREQADRVREFLDAYRRSIQWINSHRKKGAERVVHYQILSSPEAARESIPRCNMKFRRADEVKDRVHSYLQTFYRMNPDIVGGKIPDENFYFQK